jgi:hypothetical protein
VWRRRGLACDSNGYLLKVEEDARERLGGSADAVSGGLAMLFEGDRQGITAICPACGYPTVRPDLCASCRPVLIAA